MENNAIIALVIFVVAYALIILEKVHRTIVAMIGGLLLVVFGVVTQEAAIDYIDFNTIGLLIGMMIIVYITAETGVFKFIATWLAKKVQGNPILLMTVLSLFTAVASAFLDNVTTVLLVVPVTISITKELKLPPIPYLILIIISSNIGGTATMIGDPPNIMIGSAVEQLTFLSFIKNLAFICVIILAVNIALFAFYYGKSLKTSDELRKNLMKKNEFDELKDRTLLLKSLFVIALTIGGFFLHEFIHLETAIIALLGAFILLLIAGDQHVHHALEKVEWTTLFFFIGLFVMVGGLVETGLISIVADKAIGITGGEPKSTAILILWMSAIVSAFVDNIPFVATMIPMIKDMGHLGITNLEPLWWALSLGACLGGNGTLIGASANLVVAGLASAEGYQISFVKFLKIGFPLMILSIFISTIYLFLRYLM